jgi:LruC domain-containing protein
MKNFIMNKASPVVLVVILLTLSSCLKYDLDNMTNRVNSFNEISVPPAFNYATTRNVALNLAINNADLNRKYSYVAKVYSAPPDKGGTVLITGAFDNTTFLYQEVLNLPTSQTYVYVEVYLSRDLIFASTATVSNDTVDLTISKSILESDSNDQDGDGIVDALDDFPDEKQRAFLIQSASGTLLFEDQWPGFGDYDFNDLVIGYQYLYVANAKNEITRFIANFQILAIGATLSNGFGFAIPIPGDQIKSVKGYSRVGSSINLDANGTESGHLNESVVIVYDNLSVLGNLLNVYKGGATQTIAPIQIDISFAGKVTLAQLYAINPFIFIGRDRGKEVHLVGYSPTNSANKSYFGLGNDNSSEMFYSSKKGFPWALNIPAPIAYMQESVDFVKGYPDFAGWVESGGSKNKDWYTKNINKVALY